MKYRETRVIKGRGLGGAGRGDVEGRSRGGGWGEVEGRLRGADWGGLCWTPCTSWTRRIRRSTCCQWRRWLTGWSRNGPARCLCLISMFVSSASVTRHLLRHRPKFTFYTFTPDPNLQNPHLHIIKQPTSGLLESEKAAWCLWFGLMLCLYYLDVPPPKGWISKSTFVITHKKIIEIKLVSGCACYDTS